MVESISQICLLTMYSEASLGLPLVNLVMEIVLSLYEHFFVIA